MESGIVDSGYSASCIFPLTSIMPELIGMSNETIASVSHSTPIGLTLSKSTLDLWHLHSGPHSHNADGQLYSTLSMYEVNMTL